ncbi:hypothetical protein ABK046_46430, partial [Streptomyces caeruleatus]
MLKTIFVNTLKLIVVGALIGWLMGSGKLDFKLLIGLKEHPLAVICAFLLLTLNNLFVSWRWRNILKAR